MQAGKNTGKKKNVLISVLSVVLAATMLFGGGTYAYLQDTTDDVVNNFDTNKVLVDLVETTGEDYNIIPGTSEEKDPTVKVNTTIPAYVYVTVIDETDGLVTYEIADGWTLLDGTNNIYYREVEGSDAEQSFPVLKDNTVSYDAALENSDMLDANGNLKEGITLTFQASAMQKEPFASAVDAYKGIPVTVDASTAPLRSTVINLLQDSRTVVLNTPLNSTNTSARNIITVESGNGVLDLNGQTITGYSRRYASNLWAIGASGEGTVLTLTGDGTVYGGTGCTSNTAVYAQNKAKVVILDGNYTTGIGMNNTPNSVVLANSGATVEIYGGKFYTSYGSSYTGQNWVLNLQDNTNSKIICYGGTFVNFDPSCTGTEPAGQNDNFVADGYHVVTETQDNGDIWYTVVKD